MLALAALAAVAPLGLPLQDEQPVLELRVNRAIARGVGYLKSMQQPDGGFGGYEQHPGGRTAFCALALAEAGVRRSDPALVRALQAIEDFEPRSTYGASVYLLMVEALGAPEDLRPGAQACLDFLVETAVNGVWAYPWGHLCLSNTQFALIALRGADRIGLDVPESAVLGAIDGMDTFRHRSGGFVYAPGGEPYAGVTAAALASYAALEQLADGSSKATSALRRERKAIAGAEAWLAQRFDPTRNTLGNGSWTPFWHMAYMWAIERWCGLTGRQQFAGRDWYREGATWLVETQAPEGCWTLQDTRIENTCLALLFLRRATVSSGGELAEVDAATDGEDAVRPAVPERPGPAAVRLTEWWVAGPWADTPAGELLLEPPFDPLEVVPDGRDRVGRRKWQPVDLRADRWDDLDVLTGRTGDRQLWCLGTWLRVEPDPSDPERPVEILLWLDLEDGHDVVVAGERRARDRRVRAAINGDVRVPLRLAPGSHPVVVVVQDEFGAAAVGARLTDAANGAPPERVRAGREPPR